MKLTVSYDPDPEVDVLNITLEQRPWGGWGLESNSNFVVKVGEKGDQDVIGILVIFTSYKVAPYFRVAGETNPRQAGGGQFASYDRTTDTLTWGVTTDAPDMVSHTGDLTVYWRPDQDYPDKFNNPIGVSLRNAAQHLAPHFELVEIPAAGGEGQG